jgi:hypothetical protein
VAWIGGSGTGDYEIGLDTDTQHSGEASAFVRSKKANPEGFASITQLITPKAYLNKRLRLRGFIKTAEVEGWSGMWMRVDGPGGRSMRQTLAFDNMASRPISGTTSWTEYDVVLDVPSYATGIAFGVLLEGNGTVWIDDMTLEAVASDVATTDQYHPDQLAGALNLDFERDIDKASRSGP